MWVQTLMFCSSVKETKLYLEQADTQHVLLLVVLEKNDIN